MKTTTCGICGNIVPGIENDDFVCCAACHEELRNEETRIFLHEQEMRVECSEFAFHIQDVCLECGKLVNEDELDCYGRCMPCVIADELDDSCPQCGLYDCFDC